MEADTKWPERLQGRVTHVSKDRTYGFITVRRFGEEDNVQFHFYREAFGRQPSAAAVGIDVEFTPFKLNLPGKRDKATEIVPVS